MSEVIGKNENAAICVYCTYKWHFKTHKELEEQYEFGHGMSTLASFYPSGIWLTNCFNYSYLEHGIWIDLNEGDLDERGIIWQKQITYDEFFKLLKDGSISELYDWEETGLEFEGKLPDHVQRFIQEECGFSDLLVLANIKVEKNKWRGKHE